MVEVGRNKFVNPSSLLNAKPTVTGVGRPLIGPGTTKVTNMGITTSTTVPLIVVGSNVPGLDTNTIFMFSHSARQNKGVVRIGFFFNIFEKKP